MSRDSPKIISSLDFVSNNVHSKKTEEMYKIKGPVVASVILNAFKIIDLTSKLVYSVFNKVHVCKLTISRFAVIFFVLTSVLSVRFEEVVSLLLAPAGADKRGPKAPFLLMENAGIQPAIRKRVPAGAPAGAGSY